MMTDHTDNTTQVDPDLINYREDTPDSTDADYAGAVEEGGRQLAFEFEAPEKKGPGNPGVDPTQNALRQALGLSVWEVMHGLRGLGWSPTQIEAAMAEKRLGIVVDTVLRHVDDAAPVMLGTNAQAGVAAAQLKFANITDTTQRAMAIEADMRLIGHLAGAYLASRVMASNLRWAEYHRFGDKADRYAQVFSHPRLPTPPDLVDAALIGERSGVNTAHLWPSLLWQEVLLDAVAVGLHPLCRGRPAAVGWVPLYALYRCATSFSPTDRSDHGTLKSRIAMQLDAHLDFGRFVDGAEKLLTTVGLLPNRPASVDELLARAEPLAGMCAPLLHPSS